MMSNNNPSHEPSASVAGQIGQLVQAGLPIESGLRALAEQTWSPQIRSNLIELSRRLEKGVPLPTALQESDIELPESMKALIEAGLATGRLESVMQYSIEQAQRSASLRQQIWLGLSYPIFLIWLGVLCCIAFLIFIVPSFARIFDNFGMELPLLTVTIVRMASALRVTGLGEREWAIIFSVALILSFKLFLFGFSRRMQNRATSIPIIGRIFRYAALSDFCQILSLLVESRLSLPASLRFAGKASEDPWLRKSTQTIAQDIESGSKPDLAASKAELPGTLVQVFHNSNAEQAFVETLRGLSEIYAAQSSLASRLASSLIGPFTVVFVTFFAAFTILGLFLPLIKLLNDLS